MFNFFLIFSIHADCLRNLKQLQKSGKYFEKLQRFCMHVQIYPEFYIIYIANTVWQSLLFSLSMIYLTAFCTPVPQYFSLFICSLGGRPICYLPLACHPVRETRSFQTTESLCNTANAFTSDTGFPHTRHILPAWPLRVLTGIGCKRSPEIPQLTDT